MGVERAHTTHYCLRFILIFSQMMGLMPIHNIGSNNPSELKFKWLSFKVFYSIFLGVVFLIFATMSFYKALTEGIFINQLITPLFYFHSFCTTILLIDVSMRWPKFITNLSKFEEHLWKKYKRDVNLRKKLNFAAIIIILVALLEHSLAVSNSIFSTNCQNNYSGWEHHFKKQSHFIFRWVPYNVVAGWIFMIVSWYASYAWNFGDIFIVLLSMVLSARFNQVTHKIRVYSQEVRSVNGVKEITTNFFKVYNKFDSKVELAFWQEIREDYNKLCQITRCLDKLLSNIVLLSYACNLTFILVQLFNSLRHMQLAIQAVYFYYSFGFVIIRILVVSISGASINEASQDPLYLLHSLPTEVYNEEIQRLITQVHIDSAALTGHNFFRITKGIVLSVAAAIITYELVLVQFNQATIEKYLADNDTICL